jgi:adenylate cyclase
MVNDRGDILIHPDADVVSGRVKSVMNTEALVPGENHVSTHSRGHSFVSMRRIASGGAAVLTEIEDSVILEGINATTIRNIYFAVFVWFLSLLLIRFFSARLTRQLDILNEAAEEIEDGRYDYSRSIPVKTHDETGILTETMNSMSRALHSFERFTNKEIAKRTREGRLTTGGSYKRAAFLFSDIRSFTAISEKLPPAEVVEFLNDYMKRMVDCVMVSGGAIDKFIGDAVMAHWGAVRAEDETRDSSGVLDALGAVRAALMMSVSLQCFNRG